MHKARSPAGEVFYNILFADVEVSHKRQIASDTQSNRRDLVRTVFACIEGLLWNLRTGIADDAKETLNHHEYAALVEETYNVSDSGAIKAATRFLPFVSSVRLTISVLQKIRPSFQVDFNSRGWFALLEAVKIRHRLTHPKSEDDLQVSANDIRKVIVAYGWTVSTFIRALDEQAEYLRENRERLEEEGKRLARVNTILRNLIDTKRIKASKKKPSRRKATNADQRTGK